MPTIERIAWLAGILDGEGCILLWLQPQTGHHTVKVVIANTDEGILSEVESILKEWSIFYTKYQSSCCKKPCYSIEVNRKLEAKYLIEQLLPYIKSNDKRQKAFKLLDYLENMKRADGKASNCRKRKN